MTDQDPTLPLSPDAIRQLERQREINKCLVELRSNNPHHRSTAAKRLGELKAGSEALMAAMDDPNGFVRSAAAEALGHAVNEPTPEIVEGLLSAIDDSNDYVCSAAINSLGLLRVGEAAVQILPCLEDRNPVVVQAAILALARISPPGIADHLIPFLDSEQYLIHLAATRAVGLLGYHQAGEAILHRLEELIKDTRLLDLKLGRLYIGTLVKLQMTAAIPLLIEIAGHEVGLRSAAVEALIELNAEEAAPILAPLLSDPSNKLRRYLVELMIKSNFRAALPFIRPLLKDTTITLREMALEVVARWKDRVSVDTIRWMCFHDPNPFIRPQAINALVDLMGEEAISSLIALGQDVNIHVRRTVAFHLARASQLPIEGQQIFNQLSQEPELAESVHAALSANPLYHGEPFQEITNEPRTQSIPASLLADRELLLTQLETWQAYLPDMAREIPLEDISRIDEALSTLILILKKNENDTA